MFVKWVQRQNQSNYALDWVSKDGKLIKYEIVNNNKQVKAIIGAKRITAIEPLQSE
jgi:hypothetical protein